MSAVDIRMPAVLAPVFSGNAPVRGAYGGRGSGKTRAFAKMAAVKGYMFAKAGIAGQILCAREHLNSLSDSSLEEIKIAIREEPWLEAFYDVGETYIRTRDGRVSFTFAGLRTNINSIKSKARILLAWVDEAETVMESSWSKLIPTLREEGGEGGGWQAELWVTWNPESEKSATHKRFRINPPAGAKIVPCNWQDNPWFPAVLERARLHDMETDPENYANIWEGDFIRIRRGSYFGSALEQARREGRIGFIPRDPLIEVRAYWDIGGTGGNADATAIWLVQFIGPEIRWLESYEASGQPLEAHIHWLQTRGYPVRTCVLPHDGKTHDRVYAVTFESALRVAGFDVRVVPNQGRGAAMKRIEAMRRILPASRFNAATTEDGVAALMLYHEKVDEQRGVGLGPRHDSTSHIADAAGLVAVSYEIQKSRVGKVLPVFKPPVVA